MDRKHVSRASGPEAASALGEKIENLRRLSRETTRLQQTFLKSYQRIWSAPAIRGDPAARALMMRIAAARDIEQLEDRVAQLAARVSELVLRSSAGPGRAAESRGRSSCARRPSTLEDGEAETISGRTFLRL